MTSNFEYFKKSFHDLQEKIEHFKEKNLKSQVQVQDSPLSSAVQENRVVVELSASSVALSTLVILLLLLLFYFLFQIHGILVLFFVSFLFAGALDPVIGSLQKHKVPRSVGVLFIYLCVFIVLGLLLAKLVPLLASQVLGIARTVGVFVQDVTAGNVVDFPFQNQLKPYFDQIYQAIDLKTAADQIQSALKVVADQLFNISFGLMNVFLVLVLTFFMTVEEKALERFYLSLFPSRYGKYISSRLEAIKEKIGYWLRGQFLLSVAAALLSYVGLLLLRVDYALTLSVIAGVLIVIPLVGRLFALILSLPIIINQSPLLALWVSIYYFVLMQVEGNILIPYIMKKTVGLSPIIVTFAMLVGWQYLGILGVIISIPIATTLAIFVKDYTQRVSKT